MAPLPTHGLQAEDFLIFLYIFARVSGVFLLSPLLAGKSIPIVVRGFLTVGTTILLSMVLFPSYQKNFVLDNTLQQGEVIFLIAIALVKEVAVGYLIGFCFSILFEAMVLAGELIDSMMGLSTAQFFDPLSQTFKSLLAELFLLSAMVLMFAMDLHHVFFRILADSFNYIPLGYYQLSNNLLRDITLEVAAIFTFGIKIAAIPMIILVLTAAAIGFISRTLPEFNPLITGVSLRIVVGLFAVMATLRLFPSFIEHAFVNLTELAQVFLNPR